LSQFSSSRCGYLRARAPTALAAVEAEWSTTAPADQLSSSRPRRIAVQINRAVGDGEVAHGARDLGHLAQPFLEHGLERKNTAQCSCMARCIARRSAGLGPALTRDGPVEARDRRFRPAAGRPMR